ncbi:hypothetical protein MHO82_24370 [Vibrio sp. Of7-15]|uniref:hypothetical protein n=1 Tax=Vibrio sp. Of7-15 TaxID=2724879 RepID=UPI001EF1875F|nr:hypothetical protein [Vibrio sp. Of7-15]MCG7500002.1 hypothetical protein [Vibrio sp. Of7-15]
MTYNSALMNIDCHIELQHLLIEIDYERYANIGDILERFYCYKHNLVTSNNKPDWKQLQQFAVHSQAAKTSKQVICESTLPEEVLTGELKKRARIQEWDEESLTLFLEEHLAYMTITKEQKKHLASLGLDKRMPTQFYKDNPPLIEALYLRYDTANIKW